MANHLFHCFSIASCYSGFCKVSDLSEQPSQTKQRGFSTRHAIPACSVSDSKLQLLASTLYNLPSNENSLRAHPCSQSNISTELAVEMIRTLLKKAVSIKENLWHAIPGCRNTITKGIIYQQLCTISDVKMLLYTSAHNSISNRNDNGKSSGEKKDSQRQAKDLSDVHSGGPQEQIVISEENAACREFCKKAVNGSLIHSATHFCRYH